MNTQLPFSNSNYSSITFIASPIAKSPSILRTVLSEKGLVLERAKGTAIPIMKTNEGNTKSAGLSPSQAGCFIHQGGLGPLQSTIIIPIIVRPRKMSNEFSLCLSVLIGVVEREVTVLLTPGESLSSRF